MTMMTMRLSDVGLVSSDGLYPQSAPRPVAEFLEFAVRAIAGDMSFHPHTPTLRIRDTVHILRVILFQSTAVFEHLILSR